TLSETSNFANALISPVFGSTLTRNSRAGPTAFLAAETRASSTAANNVARLMPFSRSQYSKIVNNSAFIHSAAQSPGTSGEQKSRQRPSDDFRCWQPSNKICAALILVGPFP